MSNMYPNSFAGASQQGYQQLSTALMGRVEEKTDEFTEWGRKVRMERRKKMILVPLWSLVIVAVVCALSSSIWCVWQITNIPVGGKLFLMSVILGVLGVISIAVAYTWEPWRPWRE